MPPELPIEGALRLAVALARAPLDRDHVPEPGDLVVECSWFTNGPDPDAIGWLVAHGDAPYGVDDPLDGSVPMREIWDVAPLNPSAKVQYTDTDGRGYQRWENARFCKVPDHIVQQMGWK